MAYEKGPIVGNGKEFGQYGSVGISICLDDLPPVCRKLAGNGKTYINVKVHKRQSPSQYGDTHYVEADMFVPQKQTLPPQQQTPQQQVPMQQGYQNTTAMQQPQQPMQPQQPIQQYAQQPAPPQMQYAPQQPQPPMQQPAPCLPRTEVV